VEEMKNKEKYAKEILEIACSGGSIAIIKKSGHIVPCNGAICSLCLFRGYDCEEKTREWAESEYIEKLVISKRDRAFLEYLDTIIHYVTRDLNDDLYIYISKPHKLIDCWESEREADKILRMFNIDLPMVKWEDDKPWLIEDLKKLEVVEEYEKH
jgi:hypothetical protein